jgi:hypothetical protein
MGMRFSKFHSISHITNDIRNMGVVAWTLDRTSQGTYQNSSNVDSKKRRNL